MISRSKIQHWIIFLVQRCSVLAVCLSPFVICARDFQTVRLYSRDVRSYICFPIRHSNALLLAESDAYLGLH